MVRGRVGTSFMKTGRTLSVARSGISRPWRNDVDFESRAVPRTAIEGLANANLRTGQIVIGIVVRIRKLKRFDVAVYACNVDALPAVVPCRDRVVDETSIPSAEICRVTKER